MKHYFKLSLLALIGLATAGCPSQQAMRGGAAFRAGENDALVHTPSEIALPARVGEFVREGTNEYARDGSDVSAAYNAIAAPGPIAATTYVYPSPKLTSFGSPQSVIESARARLTEGELARCRADLEHAHEGAQLVSQQTLPGPGGRPMTVVEYRYTTFFAGAARPVISRLYLSTYVRDAWCVKHRITFAAGPNAALMGDQAAAFVSAFPY